MRERHLLEASGLASSAGVGGWSFMRDDTLAHSLRLRAARHPSRTCSESSSSSLSSVEQRLITADPETPPSTESTALIQQTPLPPQYPFTFTCPPHQQLVPPGYTLVALPNHAVAPPGWQYETSRAPSGSKRKWSDVDKVVDQRKMPRFEHVAD